MPQRTLVLAALLLTLVMPSAAQRSSARRGPLRYGEELRGEAPGTSPLVCRALYLRANARTGGDLLLNHMVGDYLTLLPGFVAYRTCTLSTTTNPPRPEGLGPWAVVDITRKRVDFPRFYLFDEARSTPAWRRNLVAYWGVYKSPSGALTLQALVVDWQHRVIVLREATTLEAPANSSPLQAPRWIKVPASKAGDDSRLEAHFQFAGHTLRLAIPPRVLR